MQDDELESTKERHVPLILKLSGDAIHDSVLNAGNCIIQKPTHTEGISDDATEERNVDARFLLLIVMRILRVITSVVVAVFTAA